MPLIGGALGYRLLRSIASRQPRAGADDGLHGTAAMDPAPDATLDTETARLAATLGTGFLDGIRGRTVLDYGCGPGREAVAMALAGAWRVIGLDIQERWLAQARDLARRHGVDDRCVFTTSTGEQADVIVSLDAFEHFADPLAVLHDMSARLAPGGRVAVAFGPPWLHPRGGHLFSVFPWAHLVFTEAALIRWRADFKHDGATRFSEVEGGLNRMTLARFERLVARSPLRLESLDPVPIKGLGSLRSPLLREFGTSLVRCTLAPALR